ncbi:MULTISPECIES: hypothetical protein [unclassified Endozoicomonas]|uniref:hypothetical protein n=1 Tax=unclassified Endozoicomonas TaxID=2644528 RepID=UPI002148ADCA|nr:MULTISPECIES: hypothetical protein [unclassified Endozoicomonas]
MCAGHDFTVTKNKLLPVREDSVRHLLTKKLVARIKDTSNENIPKLMPLFLCLLIICSVAHSGISKEEQFNLLSHYNNASLVEDSLKLVTSGSVLAVSTVINYGFWYGICKSPELVSSLAARFGLNGPERNELQEFKSSFCNQLAAVITSTEAAIAGQVSPSSPELQWWRPLRYVGTAYIGYRAYTKCDPGFIPIITAAYFTHEMVARTVAGAITIQALRYPDRPSIQPVNYTCREYAVLKSITCVMFGAMLYNKFLATGSSTDKAIYAYLALASLIELVLPVSHFSASHSGSAHAVELQAGAETLAGSMATASAGAFFVGIFDLALSTAVAGYMVFSLSKTEFLSGVEDEVLSGALVGAGVGFGVGFGVLILLLKQNLELDSNRLLRNIAITLAPALAIALINGFSNNIVYGYSLEDSFSETAHNQWKKFYVPLDYLYTLFN